MSEAQSTQNQLQCPGGILELCTPYCALHTCPVCRVQYGVRNFGKRRAQFRWWRARRAQERPAAADRWGGGRGRPPPPFTPCLGARQGRARRAGDATASGGRR